MVVLILAGPTAAGKTDAAIAVRRRTGARLISADAMQVYRGLDIGTGKPSPRELEANPHACLNVREPHQDYNAADFAADADPIIALGGPIVVVGGTGLYMRALLTGLVQAPRADAATREALEALPDPHGELRRVDPVLAARLHPNDRVRILRGLEVYRLSGQTLSSLHDADVGKIRHPSVRLWLDRSDLDARIDQRVLAMVEAGLVQEIAKALSGGVDRRCKPMRSMGYKHFVQHLDGGLSMDEAIRRTQRDTRKFARRQRSYLRSLSGFRQVDARDHSVILAAAEEAFGH
jgi:tRNA dimethylallyltransferase